jgi:predicted MFS family arabinose efflux permease
MGLAFVLAALVALEVVQPWHILVMAFLTGTANAFDTPARQSLVVELVERKDITNAIALNGTMFNSGAILGPALGGLIYAAAGPAWCFTINGISFLAVIAALWLMRLAALPVLTRSVSASAAIRESIKYVRSDRLVATLTVTAFYLNVFGFGLVTLMPAWAVNVLGGDVTTNGVLLSARGAGAVIGGLAIAAFAARGVRGRMWAASSWLLPLTIFLFALTRWLPAALLLLAAMGFSLMTIMNNSNAMIQSRVPDELRGRVMGLYSLMFMGGGPIGALLVGLIADRTGEPVTAMLCAGMILIFALLILFFRPEVRQMK